MFIEEQGIPEDIELDDDKIKAKYFIALIDDNYVGTARYRYTNLGAKIERFAVLGEYRKMGIGKSLVTFLLLLLKKEKSVYLHAQESVVNFYLRLGFKKDSNLFFEAGVPHYKLIRR